MCADTVKWERIILDAAPPLDAASSLAVGDLDGDGQNEVVIGGAGGLLWYRPNTGDRGLIAEGSFAVGLALGDLDGDGFLEVAAPWRQSETSTWTIRWYDPGADLDAPWSAHTVDPACNGSAHDLLLFDIDGDGEQELLANAAYCDVPGIFIYKPGADLAAPWFKHTVGTGIFSEGLCAADLDGDGKFEIVHGPDWYIPPPDGPFSSPWDRRVYAPSFREMSRTAIVDLTGNGRHDILIAESEYVDGHISWFENHLAEQSEHPWIEHKMGRGLVFAHSLDVHRDESTGQVRVLVAEMAAGGWDQPYNWDARLIEFATSDRGQTWRRAIIDQGAGTHQAVLYDVDGDGALEVVGKEWGKARKLPRIQIWKQCQAPSPLTRFQHRFLDRDKPYTGTDILAVDLDGSGLLDVACGAWWYRNPSWDRYDIPGIYQVHYAYDVDGDGRDELIATKTAPVPPADPYYPSGLCSDFCWLKPIDPVNGQWEEHPIGSGPGNDAWPHGTVVAPLLPGGRPALIACYHGNATPELFAVPDDPETFPWPKRPLIGLDHKEEIVAYDLTGDGKLDLVTGTEWLENMGDGTFQVHCLYEGFKAARVRVADVNGNGRPDVVFCRMNLDHEAEVAHFEPVGWLENPGDPRQTPWSVHVIDRVRSPHSLDVADLDGDGEWEIVVAEHDPFTPYRARNRLLAYKKADPLCRAWKQYVLDDRFEHHCGTRVFEVAPGRLGIASHGWAENRYVHLWTPGPD